MRVRVRVGDGLELAYLDEGPRDAPALLLISGLGGRKEGWARQVARLHDRFRLVVPDPRGMGGSSVSSTPCTMADLAGDLVALLDALGLERAHAWGVSMGGKVALAVALAHPDRVDKLVLTATSPGGTHHVGERSDAWLREGALAHEVYAERVVPRLFGRTFQGRHPHLVEAFARARRRSPPDPAGLACQWAASDAFDPWEDLPAVTAPTLVLTGDEDEVVDPGNSEVLAGRIPGATLAVIPGAGHSPHVERPDAVAETVTRFLGG